MLSLDLHNTIRENVINCVIRWNELKYKRTKDVNRGNELISKRTRCASRSITIRYLQRLTFAFFLKFPKSLQGVREPKIRINWRNDRKGVWEEQTDRNTLHYGKGELGDIPKRRIRIVYSGGMPRNPAQFRISLEGNYNYVISLRLHGGSDDSCH